MLLNVAYRCKPAVGAQQVDEVQDVERDLRLDPLEGQPEVEAHVELVLPRRPAGISRDDLADVRRQAVVTVDVVDEVL